MRNGNSMARRLAGMMLSLLLVLAIGFAAGSGIAWLSTDSGLFGSRPTAGGTPSETMPEEVGEQAAGVPVPNAQPVVSPTQHATYTPWDEAESPNYYRVVGPAEVGDMPEAGTVWYGSLDGLGRTTGAVALVTYESMEAGRDRSRGNLSDVTPSGWGHNREVDIAMPDGSVYHGLLFNRSHLVAKSLGGDDEPHNLVMGTRTQNVGANVGGEDGGMAYAEGLARNWLYAHPDGTVYYAATPAYEGDEPVARSVIVDVRSSDGTVDQRVEVYNAARGFAIDYATGAFEVTEQAEEAARQIRGQLSANVQQVGEREGESSAVEPNAVVAEGSPEAEDGERKVIVTGSGKAYHHDETCRGLANARSMRWVTVSEAEDMGRHPCGICGG